MADDGIGSSRLPNNIRKALGRVMNRLFDPWWDFYYTYGSSVPPKRWYMVSYLKREGLTFEDVTDRYWTDYDPVCWPLPFRINCLGCMGCGSVHDPPLSPDHFKGPYKIAFHPNFLRQWEEQFGKEATFELVWETQKKNDQIEREKEAISEKIGTN